MSSFKQNLRNAQRKLLSTLKFPSKQEIALTDIAIELATKYQSTKEPADLEEAIEAHRAGLAANPRYLDIKVSLLESLASHLYDRYIQTGFMRDLDESIQASRDLIKLTPQDASQSARRSAQLGSRLNERYRVQREERDLEEAMLIVRKALSQGPKDREVEVRLMNSLVEQLDFRFEVLEDMSDLEEAISISRKLIDVRYSPLNSKSRAFCIHSLARQLTRRASREGTVHGHKEAIFILKEALCSVQDDKVRVVLLNSLGYSLHGCFHVTGDLGHLQEAIRALREAVSLEVPDEIKAMPLYTLANLLSSRFNSIGSVKDLQDSIQAARMSIDITLPNDPLLLGRRHSLALRLGLLATTRVGSNDNHEEAMDILRDISDGPKGRARALILNTLANELFRKLERRIVEISRRDDIEQLAVNYVHFSTGADSAELRDARQTLGLDLLEEGIRTSQQALNAAPKEDIVMCAKLKWYVGIWLHARYVMSVAFGLESPTTEAMDVSPHLLREAISALPQGHIDRAILLQSLGHVLVVRNFGPQTPRKDLKNAIIYSQDALRSLPGTTGVRISAGINALKFCADNSDWQQAYEAAAITISLVLRLTSQSLDTPDKQQNLVRIAGLASDAAAVALEAGKSPTLALNFLEQGRQALITSLEHLRTEISDLEKTSPDLAKRFVSLQKELDELLLAEEILPVLTSANDDSYGLLGQQDRRQAASDEFENVILEIRGQNGFENFLLPPSEAQMRAAAADGPLIILNVSKYRCDAILVETQQIRSMRLESLTKDDVAKNTQDGALNSRRVLAWLWETIARPVLSVLQYDHCPQPGDQWPRVWWIPTGALSRFPLHAAGYHKDGLLQTVLDRVMSSYSLSIQTLVHGRLRPSSYSNTLRALLVAVAKTNNVRHLQYATQEVQEIQNILTPIVSECIMASDHRDQLIADLPKCGLFHFAGHGLTDRTDPLGSHLLLATRDRQPDPFTVATLLKLNLRNQAPFLAYLSACETGRVDDGKYIDENLHLISAYQFAGFRHVIGTLWEVNDKVCKELAMLTYQGIVNEIQGGKMTDVSVCRALHDAIREQRNLRLKGCKGEEAHESSPTGNQPNSQYEDDHLHALRSSGTVSQRDGVLADEEDDESREALDWVPYVHFGV